MTPETILVETTKNKQLTAIAYRLADGKIHLRNEIASSTQIPVSELDELIGELKSLGLVIKVIKDIEENRYQLQQPLELLQFNKISQYLTTTTQRLIKQINLFFTIDSTNQFLLQQARQNILSGTICLAEHQSHGRGRFGKYWHSPLACNIYLSILWDFVQPPAQLTYLSVSVANVIMQTLEKLGINEGIQIKWPNDILYQGAKLAGVLIETVSVKNKTRAVIGVGLNVNMSLNGISCSSPSSETMPKSTDSYIDQPWTDLCTIKSSLRHHNTPISRNYCCALLLNNLFKLLVTMDTHASDTSASDTSASDTSASMVSLKS